MGNFGVEIEVVGVRRFESEVRGAVGRAPSDIARAGVTSLTPLAVDLRVL